MSFREGFSKLLTVFSKKRKSKLILKLSNMSTPSVVNNQHKRFTLQIKGKKIFLPVNLSTPKAGLPKDLLGTLP
jgi:hypothetical protein